MAKQLSGRQLFLRYAWPCADDKLHAEKINQTAYNILKYYAENSGEPTICLLEDCFPAAVVNLLKFALEKNEKAWGFEIVAEFWRNHHGHEGDCAVSEAMVCEVNGINISVMIDSRTFLAINLYDLDLQIGDTVYLHRQVVIEKDE